jgi:hypothetical protein
LLLLVMPLLLVLLGVAEDITATGEAVDIHWILCW